MADTAFYLEQADICGKAAQAATLKNERDKYLKAQKAWEDLALDVRERHRAWAERLAGNEA